MIVLAIDYGRKRIGLALAVNGVIETRGFIEGQNRKQVFLKIREVCQKGEVEQIIIGLSRGKMGQEIRGFAKGLKEVVKLPIKLIDETLTTWQAEKMVGWKNKGKVDTVAAALILERYLDQLAFN